MQKRVPAAGCWPLCLSCQTLTLFMQASGLVKHVFRLLEQASRDKRPVPWVLLENVSSWGEVVMKSVVAHTDEACSHCAHLVHCWCLPVTLTLRVTILLLLSP